MMTGLRDSRKTHLRKARLLATIGGRIKKRSFRKGGDSPDQRWAAEIEESDVFTASRRDSRTTQTPSCETSLPQFRAHRSD